MPATRSTVAAGWALRRVTPHPPCASTVFWQLPSTSQSHGGKKKPVVTLLRNAFQTIPCSKPWQFCLETHFRQLPVHQKFYPSSPKKSKAKRSRNKAKLWKVAQFGPNFKTHPVNVRVSLKVGPKFCEILVFAVNAGVWNCCVGA